MTIPSPAGVTPHERSDEVMLLEDAPFLCCQRHIKAENPPGSVAASK